ncbi:hypothetical protein NUW58_g4565 [Xylaria curta]|uniref:Uncharacterized protein n=1 Tax=Xylaria curta TaxID=42375 RepID=A0ACC1P750_9PEZI|nr:hypothetical protein NUW58_g4565 [Xylaria curta]
MAPNSKDILTYHVVPRFDIAAKGGPLSLGTVVFDLRFLTPLNRKPFHVKVPDDLMYAPVVHTDFKDTLARARSANFKAWAKALGLPVGASADVGGSKDLERTVSCESIVTTYFDPDPAGKYLRECFAVTPIQDWLENSDDYTADLYLVTGLKVAKDLKFNKSDSSEYHLGAEVEAKDPDANVVDAGAAGEITNENQQALEFSVNDIVVGYRVNLYRCKRSWFKKTRKTADKGVLEGNMMDGRGGGEQRETDFEALPIPEELAAREEAAATGADECWVDLSA